MKKVLLAAALFVMAGVASASTYTAVGGIILTGSAIGTAVYQPIELQGFSTEALCEDAINDLVTSKVMRASTASNGTWPAGSDYRTTFATQAVTKTVAAACVLQ